MNVIFAVTEDRLEHYMYLSEVLSGSTFVAALEEDSSNIIQLVRKGYQVKYKYNKLLLRKIKK